MEATPAGISAVRRRVQFVNAPRGISVIPSGIVISVMWPQPLKALLPISVSPAGRFSSVRPSQPENAPEEMLVTVSGMAMLSKPPQL